MTKPLPRSSIVKLEVTLMLKSLFTLLILAFSFSLAQPQFTFGDLYADAATLEFSSALEAASGQTVTMLGYAAPPLKPGADFFVLTKYPMAVCPFCETEAEWPPDIVYVKLPKSGTDTIIFGALKVTGTLELGTAKDPSTGFVSKIRIQANKVERAG